MNEQKEIRNVSLIGIGVNSFLSLSKMLVGVLFNSYALVVDGIHSLSDIATDLFVLFLTRFSREDADAEHPYGHGRFETLGTTVLGCILISLGIIIGYENIIRLIDGNISNAVNKLTIIVALFSVLSNEWLFRYTLKVGKKVDSKLIIANAWHSRSDALSSIAVLVGLFFGWLGYLWMDAVVAIVVAFMISKVGWDFLWNSIKELVDSALDEKLISSIETCIGSIDGVKSFHNLRSRQMGSFAILDVNVEVDSRISVSEGHEIATFISYKVQREFKSITDVIVHIDIDDDRDAGQDFTHKKVFVLPTRSEIEKTLKSKGVDFFFFNLK
jgi:cation diffusion facilitator family transporter